MAKKLIQKWLPDMHGYRKHLHLNWVFGKLMHREHLWHINRRSVAVAFAIGLFCAFMPVPIQMLLAAAAAIVLRANLPIAVISVWITNPFTMPPAFYFCYKLGQSLLELLGHTFYFEAGFEWLGPAFSNVWQPLLLGCLITGLIAATLGYLAVHFLWRYRIRLHWRRRKKRFKHSV